MFIIGTLHHILSALWTSDIIYIFRAAGPSSSFLEVLEHRIAQTSVCLALLLVNKPALESSLRFVNSQVRKHEPTGLFFSRVSPQVAA